MKVVLFCGGLGTRLREHSETIPKPLVPVGYHPVLWHLMKYYAHYGHKDFILCLGYRGDLIREYFLNYNECLSNDFTMRDGGKRIELRSRHLDDWNITFVDTGAQSNLGERLRRVHSYLEGDEMFLANYADGLSDLRMDAYVDAFAHSKAIASFVAVRSAQSFHAVQSDEAGIVTGFGQIGAADFWINGGFFCFRREIFDYLEPGDELVEAPFQRLLAKGLLIVHKHRGFWQCMDTLKDKLALDTLDAHEEAPWQVWRTSR
jgi:glucose-1-phosphate cytidylyltransferase